MAWSEVLDVDVDSLIKRFEELKKPSIQQIAMQLFDINAELDLMKEQTEPASNNIKKGTLGLAVLALFFRGSIIMAAFVGIVAVVVMAFFFIGTKRVKEKEGELEMQKEVLMAEFKCHVSELKREMKTLKRLLEDLRTEFVALGDPTEEVTRLEISMLELFLTVDKLSTFPESDRFSNAADQCVKYCSEFNTIRSRLDLSR
ncbi:uncharacterized protein LOC121886058 isoform X1 [Scomber scombrus]|uniref:Uncharacterized protein LOC121886058 isoform X1 n=1 Tax=Scomber scombrus TaxID=13677 RepID=A0AAV1PL82_SCOSC